MKEIRLCDICETLLYTQTTIEIKTLAEAGYEYTTIEPETEIELCHRCTFSLLSYAADMRRMSEVKAIAGSY